MRRTLTFSILMMGLCGEPDWLRGRVERDHGAELGSPPRGARSRVARTVPWPAVTDDARQAQKDFGPARFSCG